MFCKNCGAELPKDGKFCENCGYAMNRVPEEIIDSNRKIHTLKISRESQFFLIDTAITVSIDKKKEYRLNSGNSVEVELPNGSHKISFSTLFYNKVIILNVNRDTSLNVSIGRFSGILNVTEGVAS